MLGLWACTPQAAVVAGAVEDSGAADTAAVDTATDSAQPPPPLELCINEFMPDNRSVLADETGAFPDWVELHNPGSKPVLLDGWSIGDDPEDLPEEVLPTGLAVPAEGYQVLFADGLPELGPAHLSVKLASDGGVIALFAPDGRGSRVSYASVPADFSIARIPDCCSGDGCFAYPFRGTPGGSNDPGAVSEENGISPGSTWRYWDQGALASGWESMAFDDGGWPSAPGPLGYGDTHQVSVIGYGADENAKYPTAYFRSSFTLGSPREVTAAQIGLMRDDGAVVYLNGIEAARSNLPEGVIAYDTLAVASAGGANETPYWTYDVDASLLLSGTNVVAVEVHQASLSSTDLGFDLSLTLTRTGP